MFLKFLDPKNDVAFKKIFGSEKNKDILIHFINDMIKFKGKGPIKEVVFLKTEQEPETAAHKTSIVDVLCKDETGHQYIVEMQVTKVKGFVKRAQYYASKAYCSQAHIGGEYANLSEIIFLAIVDFIMFPSKKAFKSDHVVMDINSYENDLKDFSFTFLELPKFDKNIDELTDNIDKWMYFFKHAIETSPEDLAKIIDHDPIIEKAYKELDSIYWNDMELRTYEQAQKRINDHYASLMQKFDEGMEKGEKRGIEKGIEKVAIAMLSKGIDTTTIATITGLSLEKVQQLHSS